jgi:hypothetical protein
MARLESWRTSLESYSSATGKTVGANEIHRAITGMVRRLAPSLLSLPRCGVLTAAQIVGESVGPLDPDPRPH